MLGIFPDKLHSFILVLSLWVLYLPSTNAGTLTPTGDNPIDASVANKNEVADYTFYFIPDTTIPATGSLTVTFPTQYTFGLGFAVDPVCSVTCVISAFSVVFIFDDPVLNGVASNVTIQSVTNPITKGGTGNFQLISRIGNNILDQNLVFGVIGISDTVGLLTSTSVSLDSSGVSNAGEVSRYAFSFKVSQIIPAMSYMKFYITDQNFGLSSYPSCSAFSINGKIITGKLTCETVGREIYVRGLSADIPAAMDVGISVSMTNPPFSGVTNVFSIAIFRNGTNAIYDRKTSISGLPITAGTLSNVALTKLNIAATRARNKVMDYTLTFLPKNSLKLGSVIVLTFPATFAIDTTYVTNNYIVSGLDDISEDVTVGLAVASNAITLTSFAAITTPSLITLQLRLINPDTFGVTTPVYINTYTDYTLATLIDQDVVNAITTINKLPSPTTHSLSPNSVSTASAIATLVFNLQPSITIAGGGVIKIIVPDGFTVATVKTALCSVMSINTGNVYVGVASCTNVDNVITLKLSASSSIPQGSAGSSFSLSNVITTPTNNGTFLFDITSYSSDGVTILESWSDYMTATSVSFTSPSVSSLCIGSGKTTILTFTFTTGLDVPAGITQTKATDTKGFIELTFATITTSQLVGGGTATTKTLIPCKPAAGLRAISGYVHCYLYPDPTNPVIRIENFQAISAGTIVSISFPKVLNPSSSYAVQMNTISLYNRIRTQLNSASLTVTVASPPSIADQGAVSSSLYTFTSNLVSTYTNITFNPGTSGNIVGPGTIILEFPYYDIGWIPSPNTIGCKLNSVYYPCKRYDNADWVTIKIPSGTTFAPGSGTTSTITVENVRIPRNNLPTLTGILVRYISGTTNQESVNRPQQYLSTATPSIPQVPTFYSAILIADKKSNGAVNAQYTMMFTSYNEIPQGASIVITFPPEYNILASYPPVQFSSPDLIDISTSSPVTFTPNVQTLTITSFQTHPPKTKFTVNIQGLRNPSNDNISNGWGIQVLYGGGTMVSQTNFDQFTYTPALNPGTITFNSITAFPLNAGEVADYTISFVPATEIPIGGQIRIVFPSDSFSSSSLPTPPDCSVSDGITTFASCTVSGTTYTIELDNAYTTDGISVTIRNIPNPGVGTTSGFDVSTYYDSTYLDKTASSDLTGRTVTIVSQATALAVKSLDCDPRNEGEPSTYTFVFLPTNTITSSMQIRITFPSVYDPNLGTDVECGTATGLSGDVACTIVDRVVSFSGFDAYTPDADNPITINIYGVINPNQNINSDTGQFKIATYYTNTEIFVDSNSAAGSFEPLPAPNWSTLFNVTATNLYARLPADYTFNFTSFLGIPSTASQGAILVDFPSDFQLSAQTLSCSSASSSFASSLACSVDRNRVTINGQTTAYTGGVNFTVQQIVNPVEAGTAGNIVLKVYDGFNAIVTERSYKNLDPFSFAYTFNGPQITVNNNLTIRVERGTQTQDLYLTLDYPCALNLTIRPTTPGFNIIPSSIPLTLGMIKSKFRVSVSEDFAEGTYEIQWETLNDLSSPFYTPIKNTKVIVTSLSNLRITVPTIYEIPYGGNSLPTYFTVDYGPDIGFEILLSLLEDYEEISLDRRNVIFVSGAQQSSFAVYSANNTYATPPVSRGTISLSLSGTNKDVYTLSSDTVDFQIISADPIAPEITELSITDITMNSANMVIGTSEIVMAYYMIALAGTAVPTMDEVANEGPPTYQTTQSVYGAVQIGTENLVTVALTGLIAETPYQVYVYVVDRGGNTNSPRSTTFTTSNRYNAADFSLRFKQSFLNSAERANIISTVAFVLSLPTAKVQERKYIISVTSSSSRLLENEDEEETNSTTALQVANEDEEQLEGRNLADTSIINLQIIAIPESSVYLSPVNLALLLNARSDMLNSRLTNYDTSYTITATAFTRYTPAFPTTPTCPSYDAEWVVIQGSLNNYGWMFTLFVKASEDYGKPSPYQIANGLNSLNIQCPYGSVEISEAYRLFDVNVTGLDPLTDYNVYIIGGSAHPGYPDLFSSDSIIILPVKTAPAPVTPHLDINDGSRMGISSVLIFLFVIIISIFS